MEEGRDVAPTPPPRAGVGDSESVAAGREGGESRPASDPPRRSASPGWSGVALAYLGRGLRLQSSRKLPGSTATKLVREAPALWRLVQKSGRGTSVGQVSSANTPAPENAGREVSTTTVVIFRAAPGVASTGRTASPADSR